VPADRRPNWQIRAAEVRIVDDDGQRVGVMPIEEALRRAEAAGLDLIEVAASASPPVCCIAQLGKLRIEQDKRAREAKKHPHVSEVKEVRLRPRTDEHDLAGARQSRASIPARRAQGESRGARRDAELDMHPRSRPIQLSGIGGKKEPLPKNDAVEMDGTIIDTLPNSQFTVRLDNGHELLAYTGGRMRRFRIRILLGDRVKVEMSPYDLSRGRVSYRYR
jgi:translation initiation factor IF-1